MYFKPVLLALAAGVVVWYGEKDTTELSETQVEALYQQYGAAFQRGDQSTICNFFSEKVTGRYSTTAQPSSAAPTPPVIKQFDKTAACDLVENFKKLRADLQSNFGKETQVGFTNAINAIALSADRKTATVDLDMQMNISTAQGVLLEMRTNRTDVIRRRMGKPEIVQSDASIRLVQ
jgi:hypothetical protein